MASDVDTSSQEVGKNMDRTDEEVEIDEDLQVVKGGDVHCVWCNKDFENMPKLKKHVELYHKNVYLHCCNIYKKGFNSLEGLHTHQKVYKGTMIKCDECETTFTTDRAKSGT